MDRFSSEEVQDLAVLPAGQVRAVALEQDGRRSTIAMVDGDCRECWSVTCEPGDVPEDVDDLRRGLRHARLVVGADLARVERVLASIDVDLGDAVRFDVVDELSRAEYLKNQLPASGLEGVCEVMGVVSDQVDEAGEAAAVDSMGCFRALAANEHYLTACAVASFLSYNDVGAEATSFEHNVDVAFAQADPDRPRPRLGLSMGACVSVLVMAVLLVVVLYGVIEPL